MDLFVPIVNKHAPLRKFTVKPNGAPWIDEELKNLMKQRNDLKRCFIASGSVNDKSAYCKIRNLITKVNREKRENCIGKGLIEPNMTVRNYGK